MFNHLCTVKLDEAAVLFCGRPLSLIQMCKLYCSLPKKYRTKLEAPGARAAAFCSRALAQLAGACYSGPCPPLKLQVSALGADCGMGVLWVWMVLSECAVSHAQLEQPYP